MTCARVRIYERKMQEKKQQKALQDSENPIEKVRLYFLLIYTAVVRTNWAEEHCYYMIAELSSV